jgi:hypothetical protein
MSPNYQASIRSRPLWQGRLAQLRIECFVRKACVHFQISVGTDTAVALALIRDLLESNCTGSTDPDR